MAPIVNVLRRLGGSLALPVAATSAEDCTVPRFVLLHHQLPAEAERASHWDLMLEHDGALRTWALAQPLAAGVTVAAEQLPDHRIAYLEYEGPVSNNRGQVTRVEAGHYELIHESASELRAKLTGQQLQGELQIVRAAETTNSANAQSWLVRLLGERSEA